MFAMKCELHKQLLPNLERPPFLPCKKSLRAPGSGRAQPHFPSGGRSRFGVYGAPNRTDSASYERQSVPHREC